MITKVFRLGRVRRKDSRSANLMMAMTLMMVLSSMLSPILGNVSAETIRNNAISVEARMAKNQESVETDEVGEQLVSESTDELVIETETPFSAIYINIYWCDDSIDVAAASDSSALAGTCLAQGPATTVNLVSNTGNSANDSQSVSGFPGGVAFPFLTADDWTIAINPGMDVNTSAFFCNGSTPTSITKSNASYSSLYNNAPTYTLETLDEEEIACDWFSTLPADTNENVSVKLTKWNCPADFNFMTAGYDAATATCWDPVNPSVEFTYTDLKDENDPNDDLVLVQSTDPNANDSTTFTSTGAATLIISENVPANYELTAVHCSFDGDTPVNVSLDDETSFHLFVKGDEQIECDVFDTFVSDDNGNITPEDGYGDVYIYKYACDADVPGDADMNWFILNCSTPQNGATFTLETPNGNVKTDTGDTGTDGFAMMGAVKAGTYSLSEQSPTGYELAAAYCAYDSDSVYAEAPISNSATDVEVVADDVMRCNFFNAKTADGVTVTIHKWECPNGTTYNQAFGYYQSMCATAMPGVPFHIADANGVISTTSDVNGRTITGLDRGPNQSITIIEEVPADFGMPVVYCQYVDSGADPQSILVTDDSITLPVQFETAEIQCFWYNLPNDANTVIIYKWSCPESDLYNEGFHSEDEAMAWHKDNCTAPMNGVNFKLVDAATEYVDATVAGMVTFDNIVTGLIQIKESIPSGYSNQPFLICQNSYADGSSSSVYWATTINGTYNTAIDTPGMTITCDWYNHPVGPGEITVYKWTCPEGYDRTAWNADPTADCTQATNGITFKLTQPAPMPELQSNTGDSISGAVYFGGLEPGSYTLNEILTPEQTTNLKEAFIWQCYGLTTSSVQPTPLNTGVSFNFSIAGGEKITCHWFNVPKAPHGSMTVSKFNCTTEKYVADVYCYTNQTGQEFNLQKQDGANWNTIASGKTDVNGKLSFPNLAEGDYRLVEPNKEACLIKSSNITPNKNLGVKKGEDTVVHVYNCKTPAPNTKTPTTYPNTGVDPSASSSDEQRTPGVALAGLIGLAGVSMSRRRFLKRAAGVTLGAGAIALPTVAAQDLLPLDSTPVPATPGDNIFGCGTPTASTPDVISPESTPFVDQCALGAIPIQFRVPIIGVDAAVEYLEIIDGQMQPPSGAEDVTWYKETSRLGEVGNGIYAGHLNYWGIPEGVFFRLESLKEGDVIEIDGNDAKTYSYIVQWSENFPSDEEPPEDALGTTDEKAITLITCGGEWVSARAEYDHRTLVRAVLQEDLA